MINEQQTIDEREIFLTEQEKKLSTYHSQLSNAEETEQPQFSNENNLVGNVPPVKEEFWKELHQQEPQLAIKNLSKLLVSDVIKGRETVSSANQYNLIYDTNLVSAFFTISEKLSDTNSEELVECAELLVRTAIRTNTLIDLKKRLTFYKKDAKTKLATDAIEKILEEWQLQDEAFATNLNNTLIFAKRNADVLQSEQAKKPSSIHEALSKLNSTKTKRIEAHGLAWGNLADQTSQMHNMVIGGIDHKHGTPNTADINDGESQGLAGTGKFGVLDEGYFLAIFKNPEKNSTDPNDLYDIDTVVMADEVAKGVFFMRLKQAYDKAGVNLIAAKDFTDDYIAGRNIDRNDLRDDKS